MTKEKAKENCLAIQGWFENKIKETKYAKDKNLSFSLKVSQTPFKVELSVCFKKGTATLSGSVGYRTIYFEETESSSYHTSAWNDVWFYEALFSNWGSVKSDFFKQMWEKDHELTRIEEFEL